jgi:C4-dicarboxylate-binding protein DctP
MTMVRNLLGAAAFALSVAAGAATAHAQTVIKVAHDQPETSTHHQAAMRWAELVKERTSGEFEIQVFAASTLGSGTQMVEQTQAGAVEAFVLPTGWIAPFAPSVSVLDLPFLFPDRKTTYQVVDGPVGQEILKPLEDVSLKGVAFWESGFKQFTGGFPISTPADYEGKKIRTMPSEVIQKQFDAFGAVPTTITFAELYSALQQKVVDGQENPIATIAAMRFFEVQKHLTLSDHGFLAYVVVFNKPFFDGLSEEIRTVLIETAREAGQYQRDIIEEAEQRHLEEFRQAGVEIAEITDEQRAAFVEASQPVYAWFREKYGSETLDNILEEVDRLSTGN